MNLHSCIFQYTLNHTGLYKIICFFLSHMVLAVNVTKISRTHKCYVARVRDELSVSFDGGDCVMLFFYIANFCCCWFSVESIHSFDVEYAHTIYQHQHS